MDKNRKISILITAAVVLLIAGVGAIIYYAATAETRYMAKAAKENPQGEKLLRQYNDAKAKLKTNPEDFGAYFDIGFVKNEFKDYKGAVEAYKNSIKYNPNSIIAYNNMADDYTKLKDYPDAEAAYMRSLQIASNYMPTYYSLVGLYQNYYTDKKMVTERVLQDGLKANPNDQNLLSLLAGYYRDTKQNDKAIATYEEILKLRPDDKVLQDEVNSLKNGGQ
jgi:cytochrome c-type biogenesis protein CcmH/NrfG